MLRPLILILLSSALAQSQTCKTIALDATDGVTASPANHTVLFETPDIRVLDVHSTPHSAEKIHTHAYPAVMITDEFSTGSLTIEGQAPVMRVAPQDKTPRVVYLPSQGPHHAENLGDTPFHAVRIELKHPGCSLSGKPAATLDATDAVTAAPANHKVLFDNVDVRVLDVAGPPHAAEPVHTHAWPSVFYIYQSGQLRYSTPDHPGRIINASTGKPAPIWFKPEGPHSVENLADTPFHGIRVELKLADPDAAVTRP